jgi:hypothetical protein
MICHAYDYSGRTLISKEERAPTHAKDYCDRCGDCLDCCQGDICVDGHAKHFWVVYQDAPNASTAGRLVTDAAMGEIAAKIELATANQRKADIAPHIDDCPCAWCRVDRDNLT